MVICGTIVENLSKFYNVLYQYTLPVIIMSRKGEEETFKNRPGHYSDRLLLVNNCHLVQGLSYYQMNENYWTIRYLISFDGSC